MEKKMSIIEYLLKNRHRNTFMSSENGEKCKMSINFDLTKEEYDDISKHFDNKDYLLNEYKEPIKLSKDEYIILKNIDEEYQWIVRDEDKNLCLFQCKPLKYKFYWCTNVANWQMLGTFFGQFNHFFQFIAWENEEPYNIKELLESYEKGGNS